MQIVERQRRAAHKVGEVDKAFGKCFGKCVATIQRHPGSPFWYCSFKDPNGKWQKKSTKTTRRSEAVIVCQAMDKAARAASRQELSTERMHRILKHAIEEIAEISGSPLPSKPIEVFFNEWIEMQKRRDLKPDSLRLYADAVGEFCEFLGVGRHQPLSSLTPDLILRWRTTMADSVTVTTARNKVLRLRMALNAAVTMGLLPSNPAGKLPRMESAGPRDQTKSRRSFSPAEVRRVLAACEGEWVGMVSFGFYTGQRLMDIATLRWAQVDLPKREITFRQGKKGGRVVVVPMASPLERWLLAQPAPDDPEARVFDRCGITSQGVLSNQFTAVLARTGLGATRAERSARKGSGRRVMSPLSFHSLRHALATQLRAHGASEAIAMAVLGHESEAVAQNYTHLGAEELRPVIDRLPDLMA